MSDQIPPIRIQFDAQGRMVIDRAITDLNRLSRSIAEASASAGTIGQRALRNLEQDINRVAGVWRDRFAASVRLGSNELVRLSDLAVNVGRRSLYVLAGGAIAAAAGFHQLARSFLDVNERFAGLEITLRSTFRSIATARSLRDELARITATSPIPFSSLSNITRSLSVIPYTRSELALQGAQGTLGSDQGLFRRAVKLMEQILAFRPDKTAEDALFSLREALSGEWRSLIRRFDVPSTAVASAAGQSMSELRHDPEKAFRGLEKFFGSIITPQAISELVRQPQLLFQNAMEQIFDIPLLSIGDEGIYRKVTGFMAQLFDRITAFITDRFKPFAERLAGSFGGIFDNVVSLTTRAFEGLLSATGFGKEQAPTQHVFERTANAIAAGFEKIADVIPKAAKRVEELWKSFSGPLKEIFNLLKSIGSIVLNTFINHPILTSLAVFFRHSIIRGAEAGLVHITTGLASRLSTAFTTATSNAFGPGGYAGNPFYAAGAGNPQLAGAVTATAAGGYRLARALTPEQAALYGSLGLRPGFIPRDTGEAILAGQAGAQRAQRAGFGARFAAGTGLMGGGVAGAIGGIAGGLVIPAVTVGALIGAFLVFEKAVELHSARIAEFRDSVREHVAGMGILGGAGPQRNLDVSYGGRRALDALIRAGGQTDVTVPVMQRALVGRLGRYSAGTPQLDKRFELFGQTMSFDTALDRHEGLLRDLARAQEGKPFVTEVDRVTLTGGNSRQLALNSKALADAIKTQIEETAKIIDQTRREIEAIVPEQFFAGPAHNLTQNNEALFYELKESVSEFLDEGRLLSKYFEKSLGQISSQVSAFRSSDALAFSEEAMRFLDQQTAITNPAQKSLVNLDSIAKSLKANSAGMEMVEKLVAQSRTEGGFTSANTDIAALRGRITSAMEGMNPANRSMFQGLLDQLEGVSGGFPGMTSRLLGQARGAHNEMAFNLMLGQTGITSQYIVEQLSSVGNLGLSRGINDQPFMDGMRQMLRAFVRSFGGVVDGLSESDYDKIMQAIQGGIPDLTQVGDLRDISQRQSQRSLLKAWDLLAAPFESKIEDLRFAAALSHGRSGESTDLRRMISETQAAMTPIEAQRLLLRGAVNTSQAQFEGMRRMDEEGFFDRTRMRHIQEFATSEYSRTPTSDLLGQYETKLGLVGDEIAQYRRRISGLDDEQYQLRNSYEETISSLQRLREEYQQHIDVTRGRGVVDSFTVGFGGAMDDMSERAFNFRDAGLQTANALQQGFGNMFHTISTGADSARGAMRSFLSTTFEAMSQLASNQLAMMLLGPLFSAIIPRTGATTVGSGGTSFGDGGGFNLGMLQSSAMISRDVGGPVYGGQGYLIGKGGNTELFVPSANGNIYPNSALRGGMGGTVTVNVTVIEGNQSTTEIDGVGDSRQAAADLAEGVKALVYETIFESQRAGGASRR